MTYAQENLNYALSKLAEAITDPEQMRLLAAVKAAVCAQDATEARTGNTAAEQAAWLDGIGQGQANERHNAAIRSAPAAGDAQELLGALIEARRELHACQAVIHLAGGFDPAYVRDAQAALKRADAAIAVQQGEA